MLLAGAVEVNALAQGTLRQFIQRLWIEDPTFHLGGGHFTTELLRFFVGDVTSRDVFRSGDACQCSSWDENSLLGLGSKCGRLQSAVVQGIPSGCGDPTVM